MFNYHDLDDVEFEILCKDIMQIKLDSKLRAFGKGKDGGVDLTDNVNTHNIVVQVKHYINSTTSSLVGSLKKEITKVEKLKPKQYYVCCSKELTDQNINDIYCMFLDYMDSDQNIITLKEIDAFLQEGKNIEVVRKNFKLWLSSSDILSEIYNQNIFIDCETLLNDIKSEAKYFVQTNVFNECLDVLEKQRALIMVGAPGVGKTVTSKMLTLFLADKGYRVRYTTNGDLSDLKRAISTDKDCKEVILLDDCLGQCYFKLSDRQEDELLSLIKHIKLYENKMIILNSRVTIFNEAQDHSQEFQSFIQGKKIKLRVIDMDMITAVEKARIFYNHLKVNNIPSEYYAAVRSNRNYMKIVGHSNYNPRIIEYVTSQTNYSTVQPENYCEYIINNLNYPKEVWKNEFDRRLLFNDRIFMNILFSLTENMVESKILKECFYNRLMDETAVDFTIDNFNATLMHLNKSLVKIVDTRGEMMIGVLNPSINDYLKSIFYENYIELANVKKSILYFMQLERCYSEQEFEDILKGKLMDGSIFLLKDYNPNNIIILIIYLICKFKICEDPYMEVMSDKLNILNGYNTIGKFQFSKYDAVKEIFGERLYKFYKISTKIYDLNFVNNLLVDLRFDELVSVINYILKLVFEAPDMVEQQEGSFAEFIDISEGYLKLAIIEYIEEYDLEEFYDDLDINDILSDSKKENDTIVEKGSIRWDEERVVKVAVSTIHFLAVDEIETSIVDTLTKLNYEYTELFIPDLNREINDDEIYNLITSFMEPDYDDGYDLRHDTGEVSFSGELDEIDLILDRDI